MKNRLILTLSLLLTAMLGGKQVYGEENNSTGSEDIKQFLQNAAASDEAEIQLSRLATQRSTTAAVKSFAQKMIEEHTENAKEVKALATKKNVHALAEMDKKHQEILEELRTTDPSKVDKYYVDAMIDDHEDAVKLYEEGTKSKDSDIRDFAKKKLPTLKNHHEMAKALKVK